MIFNETDVCDLIMEGQGLQVLSGMLVDNTVDLEKVVEFVDSFPTGLVYYTFDEKMAIAKQYLISPRLRL